MSQNFRGTRNHRIEMVAYLEQLGLNLEYLDIGLGCVAHVRNGRQLLKHDKLGAIHILPFGSKPLHQNNGIALLLQLQCVPAAEYGIMELFYKFLS